MEYANCKYFMRACLSAFRTMAAAPSGSAVVDLICSIEKADETPVNGAERISFL